MNSEKIQNYKETIDWFIDEGKRYRNKVIRDKKAIYANKVTAEIYEYIAECLKERKKELEEK